MSKLIILLVIVTIIDFRKFSFKSNKKEILIYLTMIFTIVGISLYYNNPENKSIMQILNIIFNGS